jgi:hypothetical protein
VEKYSSHCGKSVCADRKYFQGKPLAERSALSGFSSWAPGAVDTTVLENDHINNPGMITPIWAMPDRPFFDVTISGGRLPHSYITTGWVVK